MTRRLLFQVLAGAPGPYQPQKFGATNTPQCPVCRTQQPTDALPYQPVVVNAPDGTTATLPNVRQCFCPQCGVVFVTSK